MDEPQGTCALPPERSSWNATRPGTWPTRPFFTWHEPSIQRGPAAGVVGPEGVVMILGRLSGFQDKGSLAGALVKGGLVWFLNVGKLVLALACSSPASRNGAGTKRHRVPCSPATCPPRSPLPKALDDATAAKLLRPAQADRRMLVRVTVEMLLRIGSQVSEYTGLR